MPTLSNVVRSVPSKDRSIKWAEELPAFQNVDFPRVVIQVLVLGAPVSPGVHIWQGPGPGMCFEVFNEILTF